MNRKVNVNELTPATRMHGDDEEDTLLLNGMLKEAERYLHGFAWCKEIQESYFGLGVGGIVGVFLFRIVPARDDVDDWVWVIVGDLPPAYITVDDAPNAACALDGYIGAMTKWVEAVLAGASVERLIPVNAPATRESALALRVRLAFLDENILKHYSQDLRESCGDTVQNSSPRRHPPTPKQDAK